MGKSKILEGKVVSDKMKKTRVVVVTTRIVDKRYDRFVIEKKRYKVHDEENKAKTGDTVKIMECRPYSKDTHFKMLEVMK
ncbi:MAG: 30S ribosomal protein S17 [Candidatus Omnitrophica bacterium]|nr:30S ribosomal protein S17 [Candidatus Omnitrophota bacterium]